MGSSCGDIVVVTALYFSYTVACIPLHSNMVRSGFLDLLVQLVQLQSAVDKSYWELAQHDSESMFCCWSEGQSLQSQPYPSLDGASKGSFAFLLLISSEAPEVAVKVLRVVSVSDPDVRQNMCEVSCSRETCLSIR